MTIVKGIGIMKKRCKMIIALLSAAMVLTACAKNTSDTDSNKANDTKTQDGNDPQSGNATKYSANTAAENMAVETATTEPEKKSRRGILRKKEKVQERTGNSITEQNTEMPEDYRLKKALTFPLLEKGQMTISGCR